MATKKLLGTLANMGWKPGVHKSLQYGEHSPARKAAGLGPDPLTKWRFFAVTSDQTWGCDTKQEAEQVYKSLTEELSPASFREWVRKPLTEAFQIRPHTARRTVGRDQEGFLITGRKDKDSGGFPVKIFVRKRSTAEAMVAALKRGESIDGMFKLDSLDEEDGGAPTNHAGGGAVAGLGVGPQGEPGGIPAGGTQKKKRKDDYTIEDMLDEGYEDLSAHHIARLKHLQTELGRVRFQLSRNPNSRNLKKEEGSHLRRITREFNKLVKVSEPVKQLDESAGPSDTFAGADVFDVTTEKFMASRFGKNRYHRYSRYVGEDETGEAIRQHGRSTKRDIVLKDGTTGAMIYLRRKQST